MVEDYSFGRIVVHGKEYSADIIIYPDGAIQDSWWREDGHYLIDSDIAKLLAANPEIIIIGTGAYGVMKVDLSLFEKYPKIEFHALPTAEAVKLFNRLSGGNKVGACFHLTC